MNNQLAMIISMIDNGNNNQEIIEIIFNKLKSDEYRSKKLKNVREFDRLFGTNIILEENNNIIFKDGFIDDNFVISHESGKIVWCDGYYIDSSIYDDLLNYVRNNLEIIKKNNGISMKSLFSFVRNYFSCSKESKYYDVCKYLEEWYNNYSNLVRYSNSQLFIRYELPEIICSHGASSYNGNLVDYSKLYLNHYYLNKNNINVEDDLYKKIEFDESKLFTKLNISEIKHTGAVACTEYSLLLQNFMSFLGYEIYLIGGKVNQSGHNYNVANINGHYRVLDIGQNVQGFEMKDIDEPYDLLSFGKTIVKNRSGRDIIYESEFDENYIENKIRR